MLDLQPMLHAVRLAADLCRRVQETHLVTEEKSDHSPVTMADYGAQAILCRTVSQAYPADAVIAEEAGAQFIELVPEADRREVVQMLSELLGEPVSQDDVVRWLDYGRDVEAERTWVIDPIDGTKGFIALRNYVVAAGIMVAGKPVGWVIGAPGYPTEDRRGKLFYAQSGAAFSQPLVGGMVTRLKASTRVQEAEVRALESVEKSHANHERMARVREAAGLAGVSLTRIDSMEKYARIAAGDAELYLRLPRIASSRPFMIWDHCAGTALVEAAGGRVSDVDGSPLDFSQGLSLANRGIIVSNGAIHDRVVEAVMQVLQDEGA